MAGIYEDPLILWQPENLVRLVRDYERELRSARSLCQELHALVDDAQAQLRDQRKELIGLYRRLHDTGR